MSISTLVNAAKNEKRIDAVLAEVRAELIRATQKHGPMKSTHEAYGVIAEEFHEFFLEMIANDSTRQRAELIQVAAMGCRAVLDVC